MTKTDPHTRDAGTLRLHGAGDGSVMAYCASCKDPLPSLPRGRALTLAALEEAWRNHLQALTTHPIEEH